jgi:hypothetical protein
MTISIVKKRLGVLFAILQAGKFTCIYSVFFTKRNYLLLIYLTFLFYQMDKGYIFP